MRQVRSDRAAAGAAAPGTAVLPRILDSGSSKLPKTCVQPVCLLLLLLSCMNTITFVDGARCEECREVCKAAEQVSSICIGSQTRELVSYIVPQGMDETREKCLR
jgi:hypothetical protein